MVQPLWRFPKKLKIDLPYDAPIPQLGIDTNTKQDTNVKNIFPPIFIAALQLPRYRSNLSSHQQMNVQI